MHGSDVGADFIRAYETKDSVAYFFTINKLDEHRDRLYEPILDIFSNCIQMNKMQKNQRQRILQLVAFVIALL